MNYQLEEDDLFEWKGDNYITIDVFEYKNIKYYFTNKLIGEEEPSKEFIVFKGLEKGLVIENDKSILDIVLPVFSTNMNKRLKFLEANSKVGEE